jgi:dimethylamine monooxygenase subunit A
MAFDFDAAVNAPFRMQPGLQRLAPGASQLTPMVPGSRHQREKLAVLCAFADQALVCAPRFDPAPALDALCHHAAEEHPTAWTWDGTSATAHHLGVRVGAGGAVVEQVRPGVFGLGDEILRAVQAQAPGWRMPALLSLSFEEDLAVVDAGDATVPWMAVTLPSHWAPLDKVGRHFAQIHAPVADGDLLRRAGAALTRLVCGPERWERFVWNVTDSPRLHAHPARVAPERWSHDPQASGLPRAWFRSERQTFIPVHAIGQSVFTIHVAVRPLAEAVDTPARAAQLAAAVRSMTPEVLAYRGLGAVRDPLLEWLQARATTACP